MWSSDWKFIIPVHLNLLVPKMSICNRHYKGFNLVTSQTLLGLQKIQKYFSVACWIPSYLRGTSFIISNFIFSTHVVFLKKLQALFTIAFSYKVGSDAFSIVTKIITCFQHFSISLLTSMGVCWLCLGNWDDFYAWGDLLGAYALGIHFEYSLFIPAKNIPTPWWGNLARLEKRRNYLYPCMMYKMVQWNYPYILFKCFHPLCSCSYWIAIDYL